MDPDLLPGSGPRLCIGPEYNEADNRTWEALQGPENRTWGLLKGALRKPKLVRGRSSRGGKIVPGASSGLLEPPGASWGFPGTIGWGEEAVKAEDGWGSSISFINPSLYNKKFCTPKLPIAPPWGSYVSACCGINP